MSEYVRYNMFCRTVSLQIIKALGVLLLHHLTDFGSDWRIDRSWLGGCGWSVLAERNNLPEDLDTGTAYPPTISLSLSITLYSSLHYHRHCTSTQFFIYLYLLVFSFFLRVCTCIYLKFFMYLHLLSVFTNRLLFPKNSFNRVFISKTN